MTFRLSNVAYKYKKSALPVLERIEGVFPAGGTVAILGRSGSGKTTLLSLLGLLGEDDGKLHEGEISYTDATGHEHPYAALTATDRTRLRAHRFGFIPQTCYSLPAFTVEQNILMPLYLQGGSDGKDRLRLLLKEADSGDLEAVLASSPLDISGGQRQRLAILRAIIHNPDVVFADEPMSNLDDGNKQLMFRLLRRWQAGRLHRDSLGHPRTLLLVCHDVDTAWQMINSNSNSGQPNVNRFLFLNPAAGRPGCDGCQLYQPEDFPGGAEEIRRRLFPTLPAEVP